MARTASPTSSINQPGGLPLALGEFMTGRQKFLLMNSLMLCMFVSALDQSTATLMGDAPACDGCGSITVRNGTCYRCLNCGNSMGCS